MGNIQRRVGKKLGGEAREAIAGRAVTQTKAMQETARAQQRVAADRARVTMEKAQAKAVAQAQKYVTAQGSAIALAAQRVKNASAKLERQQKRLRALAQAKRVKDAKKARRRVPGLPPVEAADAPVELAVADPPVFGELYRQTVRGGRELTPRFFQVLAKTYRTDPPKIVPAMVK